MNAKTIVMRNIGFLGGPKAQPPWAWGLGWALEIGPKAHGGWVLGLRSGPNPAHCGGLILAATNYGVRNESQSHPYRHG